MTHLGSFGAAVRELDPDAEKDTFELCGETFVVHGVMSPMLNWHLAASLYGASGKLGGIAAMWQALGQALTKPPAGDEPEDTSEFERLYDVAVRNKVGHDELVSITVKLFEVQAGRPTGEPSGSSPGRGTTSPSANGSSPSPPGMTSVADLMAGSQPSPPDDSAT